MQTTTCAHDHHDHDATVAPDAPGDDFRSFSLAISSLINCSCCSGGPLGSAPLSMPETRNTPFRRLGHVEWRKTVKRRAPIVPSRSGRYILPDVSLWHAQRALEAHRDVLIDDGRIAAIVPAGEGLADERAPRLEACRGLTLMPAFIDMHVHMPPDNALKLTNLFLLQTLRHGITIVRDAGDTDGTAMPAALSAVMSGALPGPEIHYAYGFVNHPPARWSNSFVYSDPTEADAIVSRLKFLGARWVKSYENLDRPRIAALVDAAERHGMAVMGHVPYGLGHEDALLPDGQHLFGVPHPSTIRRDHVFNRMIDWDLVDQGRMDVVRRACSVHGLAMTPTLNATIALLDLERHEAACQEATARAVPSFYPEIVWHPRHGIPAYRDIPREDFDRCRRAIEKKHHLIRQLWQDGCTLFLGTDTQQPFVSPGVALHREMKAFEDCGVPRRAVLDIVSRQSARRLKLEDCGDISVGRRAELLAFDCTPDDANWHAFDGLKAVVANGSCVLSSDLDRAIASELSRYRNAFTHHVSHWLARFTMNRLARDFVS